VLVLALLAVAVARKARAAARSSEFCSYFLLFKRAHVVLAAHTCATCAMKLPAPSAAAVAAPHVHYFYCFLHSSTPRETGLQQARFALRGVVVPYAGALAHNPGF